MEMILHIGYGKTGTTWFQKEYYPYVENINYIKRNDIFKTFKVKNISYVDKNGIEKYLYDNYNSGKKILICDESLLSGDQERIKETIKKINLLFPNARIVIFIRNQIDLIASKYYQYVRLGGTYSLHKFLYWNEKMKKWNNNLDKRFKKYYYDEVISIIERYFSRKNIDIFLYEEFSSNNYMFIKEYNKHFDFIINKKIKLKPVNKRMKEGPFKIARFFNKFTKNSVENKNYLVHIPYVYEFTRMLLFTYNIFDASRILKSYDILGNEIKNVALFYKNSNRKLLKDFSNIGIDKYKYPL